MLSERSTPHYTKLAMALFASVTNVDISGNYFERVCKLFTINAFFWFTSTFFKNSVLLQRSSLNIERSAIAFVDRY